MHLESSKPIRAQFKLRYENQCLPTTFVHLSDKAVKDGKKERGHSIMSTATVTIIYIEERGA